MIAVRLILKVVFRTLFGWRVFMGLPLNLKMAQTASQCDDDHNTTTIKRKTESQQQSCSQQWPP